MIGRVYISGAITGTVGYLERFSIAEEKLKTLGYHKMCDGIYMIPGWEDSRGAKLEYTYARCVDMVVIEEGDGGLVYS